MFLDIIANLKETFACDSMERKNGTLLLGPNGIPNCQHMIFAPLPVQYIETHLVAESYYPFPTEYAALLQHMNGANLCRVRIRMVELCFAYDLMTIFGLPLLPTGQRVQDLEEAFDVRIENLARHPDLPHNWLKCGTYIRNYDFQVTNDIWIDTSSGKVYACPKNTAKIVDSWDCLDDCLCSVYHSFDGRMSEYVL